MRLRRRDMIIYAGLRDELTSISPSRCGDIADGPSALEGARSPFTGQFLYVYLSLFVASILDTRLVMSHRRSAFRCRMRADYRRQVNRESPVITSALQSATRPRTDFPPRHDDMLT